MKSRVAIETVQGKAYFLIVNQLKKRNIAFISLVPGETIPAEIKVVITTEKEKNRIKHENILVFDAKNETDKFIDDLTKILEGKEVYERIIIGVDPGEVFGLAVVADGKVGKRENCFSIQEVLKKTKNIIENVNLSSTHVSIKIGKGVPIYKELLEILDTYLPAKVLLELVVEKGTNLPFKQNKHRRELKDISSAIQIAGRKGLIYKRRKFVEPNE